MDQRRAVRELSQALFGGARYRIEVAASLYSGVPFTSLDLVVLLGDPPGKGSIHTELKRLREAELVFEAETPQSDRSKTLVPLQCGLWAVCRELMALGEARAAKEEATRKVLAEAAAEDSELAHLLRDGP